MRGLTIARTAQMNRKSRRSQDSGFAQQTQGASRTKQTATDLSDREVGTDDEDLQIAGRNTWS